MFKHNCKVDVTLEAEGHLEYDPSYLGILKIIDKDKDYMFFFRDHSNEPPDGYDELQYRTIKLILNWLKDNSLVELSNDFEIKVLDFADEDNIDSDFIYEDDSDIEEIEQVAEAKIVTLGSILIPFEKKTNEKNKQLVLPNQHISEYFKAYQALGGVLNQNKFEIYIKFFLHIVPTCATGDSFSIGFDNTDDVMNIVVLYLMTKLNSTATKAKIQAQLMFEAVDSVHSLS